MTHGAASSVLELPPDITLPLFVYGALKPRMPAFESLRGFVEDPPEVAEVDGELCVRDGLPLLFIKDYSRVRGFLLRWQPDKERDAYRTVCEFEPRKHYQWQVVSLAGGGQANALCVRYPDKGNPQSLDQAEWNLTDDPAFGEGLETVREMVREIGSNWEWNVWQRFFRAQMAYLLLWSILERLSALCFGPARDPIKRVNLLYELHGMRELIGKHVQREDAVSDSRNPKTVYKLDKANPKKCFDYYYQVRSNLSHRGKAVHSEVEKVTESLSELSAITDGYLKSLREDSERA